MKCARVGHRAWGAVLPTLAHAGEPVASTESVRANAFLASRLAGAVT